MISQKHSLFILLVPFVVLAFFQTTQGKSVYVISNTETSQIKVYKIDGTNLTYQIDYVCELDPSGNMGAVGLAIDESEYGQFLFVTFESQNLVELVNAKTMEYVDTVTAIGASNLAGIAIDQGKKKVHNIPKIIDL